jgi:hypothetical protein
MGRERWWLMGQDKLEAAKKRYARGLQSELDPDELGRIALIVEEAARQARDFAAARDHAELAARHYRDAGDQGRSVRARRRLAGALLLLRDWTRALPLVDDVARAPDERDVDLPKLEGLADPKELALERARAHVAWASSASPRWAVIWGALFDAFSTEPIGDELERRFTARLGKRSADVASQLCADGFYLGALRAARHGTRANPTSGADWLELANAQDASDDLAGAYESYCAAAACFEQAYSPASNTYDDEEVDPDTAFHLMREDRFNYKAADAWREAASCAFHLGDRAKLTAAYDREILLRFHAKERKALPALRAALAEDRAADALEIVRRELRHSKGGTPEIRAVLERSIAEHVAAKRFREAIAVHQEILEAIAITWGERSPAYLVAQLDLATRLIELGRIGDARAVLEELATELDELSADHPFVQACTAARARVESSQDVELLECMQTTRFTTARERLARMRELLARGASLAAADAAGDTVLHFAARLRAADSGWLVRALLDVGASRSAKNAAGETALAVAVANAAQVTDVVEALWEDGASWALELAAAKGHLVTVARLRSLGASPAPAAFSRPLPRGGLVEFALRVSAATGDSSIVDTAFSDDPPGVDVVRRHLSAFCAQAGAQAMRVRFGGADAERVIAELAYTIASDQILETLVREDWPRFACEDLGLLRASIPGDIDDELGDEDELLPSLEMAFRSAAFDASPPAIRARAKRADFGKPEDDAPPKKPAKRKRRA